MPQSISTRSDAPGTVELAKFEEDFGPFDPPSDYPFEPEFKNPPPRPIPSELYQGRYCHRRKLGIIGLFAAGVVMLVCHLIPIVRIWGLYVLPFQYLHWIGAVLMISAGISWVKYLFSRGAFVYVEDGTPLVARIAALFLRVKLLVNGVPSIYEYVALFQHRDPRTGEVVFSSDAYELKTSSKDQIELSYRVGDYVTAVHLRTNPTKPPRLYGFLDLRPNLGVVAKAKVHEWTMVQLVVAIAALGAFFFTLFWNVYAFGKFKPLEMSFRDHAMPFAIGAVVLGGSWLGYLAWYARGRRKALERNNQEAMATGKTIEVPWQPKRGLFGQGILMGVILFFGGLLLGGGTVLCWAFTLNALCDTSPATLRPIRIREMWMKTHSFLFREYTIEYELTDDPAKEKQELLTTPMHMLVCSLRRTGFAHVRRGFFGWPWVETITPGEPEPDNPIVLPQAAP